MPRFWVTILILHTSTVFIFYWLSAKRLKHERIGGYVGIQGIGVIARLKGVEGLNLGRRMGDELDFGGRGRDVLDLRRRAGNGLDLRRRVGDGMDL